MKALKFWFVAIALVISLGIAYGISVNPAEAKTPYPKEPVQCIIPWPAGGAADILTRAISKYLDFTLVSINMAGAGGLIGSQEVYNSKPDGYKLLSNNPVNLMAAYMSGALEKPLYKELTTIGYLVEDSILITTSKKTGWKNWADVVKYTKANPKKVKIGVPGAASFSAACVMILIKETGADITAVPYQGGAQTRTALLGDHIQLEVTTGGDSRGVIDAGEVIPIGVIANERSKFLPNVPTYKELGVNVATGLPRAIFGPPGMDQETLNYLVAAFKKATNDPRFAKDCEKLSLEPNFRGPDYAKKWIGEQEKLFQPIYDKINAEQKKK
ncbi:MAG: tripartite tricarboxylate transporter substrate binding protein [Pseudomonadota bacterium]